MWTLYFFTYSNVVSLQTLRKKNGWMDPTVTIIPVHLEASSAARLHLKTRAASLWDIKYEIVGLLSYSLYHDLMETCRCIVSCRDDLTSSSSSYSHVTKICMVWALFQDKFWGWDSTTAWAFICVKYFKTRRKLNLSSMSRSICMQVQHLR